MQHSPGFLAGNPPSRRGAPGDDLVVRNPVTASASTREQSMSILSILEPKNDRRPVPSPIPAATPPVVGAGLRVPLADGRSVTYANLDHAASAPSLESVRTAVDATLTTYASVHRGSGWASRITTEFYEQARDEVAAFVGARASDEVVFTRQTTDALTLLSRCLPAATTVFVFDSEHHANLLPWPADRTVRLGVPRDPRTLIATLAQALRDAPTGPRLVCVTGASNVTGELFPVAEIAALAHAHGARICLDAAQLAPHRTVDIAALDVDYVAISGHKLYAPFGAGALVGRSDWLDAADPYLPGGGATERVDASGVVWATGSDRHEGGSPNVIGAVALAAACATLTEHRDAVEAHEALLSGRLRGGLGAIDGVHLLSLFSESHDRVGTVAFTVAGFPSGLVAAYLSAEHGIGVRDGKFCAHQLTDALLADDDESRAVRASLGLGSTLEHVDRLVAAIRTLVNRGTGRSYTFTEDGWAVDGDRRELPQRPW
jgi:selenocysteine lyase/cysteine desulfurase